MSSGDERGSDSGPSEDEREIEEVVEGPEVVQEPSDQQEADGNEDGDAGQPQKVDPKVKRVRNPQPKLNAETLKGPRGLCVLEGLFTKAKFQGKGHEEEDLVTLMKMYEYWCHRLFPKFPFDDSLERLERLGTKRPVQTYLKKIRMGMEDDNDEADATRLLQEDEEERVDETQDDVFGDLLPPVAHPQVEQQPDEPQGLTEEQLERIKISRERAQRLRQQALIRKKQEMQESQSSINNTQTSSMDITEMDQL